MTNMPWKQQGGGGPGGGQGPWGGGGGGGGRPPPDFEDVLRQGQDRIRRMIPGGLGSGRGVLFLVVGVLALWLLSGFYRVQPDEQGVVLRFGEWVKTPRPVSTITFPARSNQWRPPR